MEVQNFFRPIPQQAHHHEAQGPKDGLLTKVLDAVMAVLASVASFFKRLFGGASIAPVLKSRDITPLDKIGGFSNGGNTCFIATALQAVRQVPEIRKRLKDSYILTKENDESNEVFSLRSEVKATIAKLLEDSDRGEKIDGSRLRMLHSKLLELSQKRGIGGCSEVGTPGDELLIIYLITRILEIGFLEYRSYGIRPNQDSSDYPLVALLNAQIQANMPTPALVTLLRPEISHKPPNRICPPLTYDPSPIHEMIDETGKKCKYALVAATSAISGHVKAYLKDICHPNDGWVCCNDSSIDKIQKLPPENHYQYLIYAKLEGTST